MIMADVSAVFGTLLALGIAFPGLMLVLVMTFPALTERAEVRITRTPWKSFFLGAVALGFALIPVIGMFNLPDSGAQFFGFVGLAILLAAASIGAAGLTRALGKRLATLGVSASAAGETVRGAVVLELAAVFPLVGWFIIIPITLITAFGATVFAILRWQPKDRAEKPAPIIPPAEPASA